MTPEQYSIFNTEYPYFRVGEYKLELYREDDTKLKSIAWSGNREEAKTFTTALVKQGICDHAKLSIVVWDSKYTAQHP